MHFSGDILRAMKISMTVSEGFKEYPNKNTYLSIIKPIHELKQAGLFNSMAW